MSIQVALGITGDDEDDRWAYFRDQPKDFMENLLYDSRGPWPTPSPGRPLSEVAEVANLPQEEFDDWKKNVSRRYLVLLIKKFIPGLWWAYIKSGGRYNTYDDSRFNHLISRGMYSKFISKLDDGDDVLFAKEISDHGIDLEHCRKLDFAGMEHICNKTYDDMHAAASIVLLAADGHYQDDTVRYRAIAIHLYTVDSEQNKIEDTARTYSSDARKSEDQRKWQLAKYFALQGAAMRVNMTEHGRLHFPLDSVNAITKSLLPVNHPIFVLLIPHLRLTLAVDNSVLEGKQSLISRTNWVVYSPFPASGKHIRTLIPDGYVGRKNKKHAFPKYTFPFQLSEENTSFNKHLRAYYDIFHSFAKSSLALLLTERYRVDSEASHADKVAQREWEFIALWAECIREWVPGFIGRDDLNMEVKNGVVSPKRDIVISVIAHIIWNVTVAHAADHAGFASNGPQGNIFCLHVPPPLGDQEVPEDFEKHLVKRFDLFRSYLTNELFYKPLNFAILQNVNYNIDSLETDDTTRAKMREYIEVFRQQLRSCDVEQRARDSELCALADVSTSIQY